MILGFGENLRGARMGGRERRGASASGRQEGGWRAGNGGTRWWWVFGVG